MMNINPLSAVEDDKDDPNEIYDQEQFEPVESLI